MAKRRKKRSGRSTAKPELPFTVRLIDDEVHSVWETDWRVQDQLTLPSGKPRIGLHTFDDVASLMDEGTLGQLRADVFVLDVLNKLGEIDEWGSISVLTELRKWFPSAHVILCTQLRDSHPTVRQLVRDFGVDQRVVFKHQPASWYLDTLTEEKREALITDASGDNATFVFDALATIIAPEAALISEIAEDGPHVVTLSHLQKNHVELFKYFEMICPPAQKSELGKRKGAILVFSRGIGAFAAARQFGYLLRDAVLSASDSVRLSEERSPFNNWRQLKVELDREARALPLRCDGESARTADDKEHWRDKLSRLNTDGDVTGNSAFMVQNNDGEIRIGDGSHFLEVHDVFPRVFRIHVPVEAVAGIDAYIDKPEGRNNWPDPLPLLVREWEMETFYSAFPPKKKSKL